MNKHTTPLVSFAIPCYNHEKFIAETLESCLDQTYANIEIVVVDDASQDGSRTIIEDFVRRYPDKIRAAFNDQNLGQSLTARRAVAMTRGSFIAGIGSDDVSLPNRIARGMDLLAANPEIGAVFSRVELIDGAGARVENPGMASLFNDKIDNLRWRLLFGNCLCGPSVLARANLIRNNRPNPSLRYVEDFDQWLRILDTHELHRVNEVWVQYRQQGSNLSAFTRETQPLAPIYETGICIIRALQRWPIEKLFPLSTPQGSEERRHELAACHARLAQHCLFMEDELFGRPYLFTGEAYRQLTIASELNPDDALISKLAPEVFRRLGDKGRASGGKSTRLLDWKVATNSQITSDEPATDSAGNDSRTEPSGDLKGYAAWLRMREWTPGDQGVLAALATTLSEDFSLDLIIRVRQDQHSQLADTLDSLNYQIFKKWHVHVVSQDPVPAGVDSVDCISWHTVPIDASKRLIDDLVAQSTANLIVELPAGAVLDPRCLWRIAREANEYPEICAFFCDDDIYDESGNRQIPRFKPGANPAWLLSQDLAGPLFVRREAWHRSGGASEEEGSPWFDQLLRVAKNVGWNHIRHIPDVLLSFASRPPSDMESCLRALGTQLQRDDASFQLELASQQSWHVRHVLQTLPRSTVAIFSTGQFDLLNRCLTSLLENTRGIEFDVVLSVPHLNSDVEFEAWLGQCEAASRGMIRVVRHEPESRFAERFNAVLASATTDQMACMDEGCVAIAATWLERMTSTAIAEAASIVSPRIVAGGSALVESAGAVIGFDGFVGSPYQHIGSLRDAGYLDYLLVRRDISVATSRCFLISTEDARSVTGADVRIADLQIAVADLSQRLLKTGGRLLYEPASVVIHTESESIERVVDARIVAQSSASTAESKGLFSSRWLKPGTADPFWNANLSLAEIQPSIETDYLAQWQHQPTTAPRILARPLTNGQGNFRITSYLSAARSVGLASECVWLQSGDREPTLPEIMRLGPDAVVVQHYILDRNLRALHEWSLGSERPFTVFAMDDLLTNMDLENPFRMGHAPNNRSRIKYALEHCDRLVVSTDFLAECCANLIADIRVVPNRLSMHAWIPLQSRRRTTPKPRIGWAGGTTHQGDLVFLKEIIEQTRSEADWIFMGMCPPEIKPLLAEYHPLVPMADYPAYLASLNLDIAVAPLAMTPFNQAKSNLRLLEYGMLGLPVICTDIDPYRNSPACRVANVVQEWIDALRARIHDADAREAEGRAMRQWVHHNFILEHHINQWVDAHTPG